MFNHEIKVKSNSTYINIEDAGWLSLKDIEVLKEEVDATFTKGNKAVVIPGYDCTFLPKKAGLRIWFSR